LTPIEAVAFASMTVLERLGAITIPAVGMPGAACTFRLMMYPDGERFGEARYVEAWHTAVDAAAAALDRPDLVRTTLFGRPETAGD
jgi:L-seryl-tRNA(Ser) seleniumtransferase